MNTQLDIVRSAKQGNAASSLIPKSIGVELFRQQELIVVNSSIEIPLSEVSVRHLKSKSDIQEIQYLRSEIDLDLHRANDPLFAEHEKKEMN